MPHRRTGVISLAFRFAGALVLGLCASLIANAQVNVTTARNDIARTGQNLSETVLTPSTVNATQFGKLFAQAVDGYVYAQPLYLSGLTVNGAVHNVVFVATEHDSVYAFDADNTSGTNSSPLWQASMFSTAHGATPGETAEQGNNDITPEIGITGTPVIDPASGTLYVVSKTIVGGTEFERLHALDVTTGAEKFGGPVTLDASVPGTGSGSAGGTVPFLPLPGRENQRPGLLLLNGVIYVGFAAHVDTNPWHGWVLAYNATTLSQTGVFCSTPNDNGGGIWMSGTGLAADQLDPAGHPFGRMFAPTGNGGFNASPPYNGTMNYGDSILDLDLSNGVPTVADAFTPSEQAQFEANDVDVAAGGLMILPTQTSGSHPHLLVQAGKSGTLYLLDRDSLGGYHTTDQVVQSSTNAVPALWSSPAYWNSAVYYAGQGDNLKSFPLVNGLLSLAPTMSHETFGFPGATPSISANGATQGIAWTIDSGAYETRGPAILAAHDASNVATTLYSSTTNTARDVAGPAVKFAVPTIANGKVFVGTANQLDVYGLLSGATQTAIPSFNPGSESFVGSLSVSIADATPNSTIYYTTDGSAVTTSSNLYSGPIAVTSTETLNAIATSPGLLISSQASATYTQTVTSTPTFTPAAGSYTAAQSVTLSDTTAGATIYYTTDGSTPTTASTAYAGSITVNATKTIKALAIASGYAASAVASAAYTITITQPAAAIPTFAPAAGTYTSAQSVTLSDTTAGATIYYTTNGATPTTASTVYTGPIAVSATQTIKALATASGFATSAVASATYTITTAQPAAATPTFSPAAGTYSTTQSVTLSDTTAGATLYYTTDGSTPTITSLVYSGPITVSASESVKAIAVASGYSNSAVGTAAYVIGSGTTSGVNYPSGFTATGLSFNGGASVSGGALVVTDGGVVESRSAWYSTPVNVQQFTTDFTFQLSGPAGATANGFTFAIQNVGLAALGAAGNGLGYAGIGTSVAVKFDLFNSAGEGSDSTGFYVNGASPTVPAVDMTASGVTLLSGDTMSAHVVYDGTTLTLTVTDQVTTASFTTSTAINIPATVGASTAYVGFTGGTGGYTATQKILSWTYSSSAGSGTTPPAATPTFTPAAGSYTAAQSVTLSDTTAGATIYYTTDGSTPTTASAVYSGPIAVNATQTIKALATASGSTASAVGSATYTITITQPTAATPTFTPAAGTYTAAQSVTLGDTTAGATIYYTTDGSTPTTASAVYSAPIAVNATQTIKALATASGSTASAVASATYTITITQPTAATPTFTPAAGTYTAAQSVTLGDTTAGATIYYTTDGSTPTTASAVYSGPITVSASESVKAIAVASGYSNSAVGTAAYVISSGTTSGVNYPSGFTATGLSFNGGASVSSGALVVTDGGVVESRSAWYSTPVNVQQFTTDFTFQLSGPAGATANGFTFAIQNVGLAALGAAGNGLGYAGIGTSVAVKFDLFNSAGEGSDSTGFYVNGASPTVPAVDMTASGVTLLSGDTMSAHVVYDGTTLTLTVTDQVTTASFTTSTAINIPATVGASTAYVGFTGGTGGYTATQKILSWTYSSSAGSGTTPPAATPTFTPAAGSYTAAQSVTLSDTTAGATIYYTTDGSTPTTASAVYSGPIAVNATQTIKALATASGSTASAVGSATYTITITQPTAATPTFTPAAGTYTAAQSVTLGDTTAGATIYYTTDGSTPTTASAVYSAPIAVNATQTIKALATASGSTASAVASATYTITITQPTAATPTFTPAAGTYTAAQSVTLGDTTAGATIYYTTDASTPTTASAVYSGPITVSASESVKAIAVASGYSNSAVGTAAYVISSGTTSGVNYPSGFTATGLSFNGGASVSSGALVVTDGGVVESRSAWYSTPVNVQQFTTDFTFQLSGPAGATANGFTFAIQNVGLAALGAAGNGLGYAGIGTSVAVKFDLFNSAGEGSDSTGFYVNGASPTVPAVDMTASGVTLLSGDTMSAHVVYDGTTLTLTVTDQVTTASFTTSTAINIPATVGASTAYVGFTGGTGGYTATQKILSWTYSSSAGSGTTPPAATPTFTPAAGSYTAAQSVTLSDTTAGATIYYTTDGSTPTTASAVYSAPIAVSATQTIKALATASGYTASAVGSATYTITITQPTAATPTFTPAAGTYTAAKSVTLSDTTAGATIYYTTNGTTPTTASTVYAGPITVSATQTIKALATASGYTASAVGSAKYTITLPVAATPTFTPAAGTYTAAKSVTLSDTTAGATIYYTTNGTTPTTASTVYAGPITVSATQTIKALAIASGYTASAVASATYTISMAAAATPTFTPAAGTYTAAQSVTLSDTTAGATIYYTTDGTTPTTASTVYAGPITVSASESVKAIAVASGYSNSAVGTAAYVIGSGTTSGVNYPSGFTATGLSFNGGASVSSGALVVTDGGVVESRSAWYSTPVNVQKFTTDFTFQLSGPAGATADGITFAIQNVGLTALGSGGSALGYGGIGTSVAVKFDLFNSAGEGSDSTGFYINGASPTVPAVDMTASGVTLLSGDTMSAHVVYDGTTLTLTVTDQVTTASFTTSTALNIPATVGASTAYVGFTGGTGGYTATQKILSWTYSAN